MLLWKIQNDTGLLNKGIFRNISFSSHFNNASPYFSVCVFWEGRGGGTPLRHGHKESYKDLNLKISTSEWDSNPRPHEYWSDALIIELL